MAWHALNRLQQQAMDDPQVLADDLRFRDIIGVLDRREGSRSRFSWFENTATA